MLLTEKVSVVCWHFYGFKVVYKWRLRGKKLICLGTISDR